MRGFLAAFAKLVGALLSVAAGLKLYFYIRQAFVFHVRQGGLLIC